MSSVLFRSHRVATRVGHDLLQWRRSFLFDASKGPPTKADIWRVRKKVYLVLTSVAFGGVCIYAGVQSVRSDLGRFPTVAKFFDSISGREGKQVLMHGGAERERSITVRGGFGAKSDLDITLYQYQTCPFCSKVRAFLDYHRIPYCKVEVNPLTRSELNFSPEYRKVPIIVANGKQVNDSSVIVTVLESYMVSMNPDCKIEEIADRHPMSEIEEDGKKRQVWKGRYLLTELSEKERKSAARQEELRWREWVDNVFIHCLAPNIYRNTAEAWQAFEYIAKVGNFGYWERWAARTAGAAALWALSGRLKAKYKLKDDVRESLYDYANEWVDGVGDRQFMGGDKPNLADLAMFGALTAIEGFYAFGDVMEHSRIKPWWNRMVALVREEGFSKENSSEEKS